MQTTTNYGFNIVEGTDIVNPLTQLNPNFTSLDSDLKAVSDNTVDNATCIKTGTVHAVTRVSDKSAINSDLINIFFIQKPKFIIGKNA